MKICVVGAGSMGGMMGVKLHNLGEDVTLIARGLHLESHSSQQRSETHHERRYGRICRRGLGRRVTCDQLDIRT